MKRHMILLPVLLAVLLIASAALYLHKPTFTFTLEKASGDKIGRASCRERVYVQV